MDYEKAYREAKKRRNVALLRCRQLSTEANMAVAQALNYVFGETNESEDERIRKTLIHIVKGACDKYGIKYKGDDITEEKLLAYLERQKEQSTLNFYVPEGADMNSTKNKIAVILGQYKSQGFIEDEEYYSMLKYIGEKEQNPAEWALPEDFEEAVYKVVNFISPFDSLEELRKTSHRFAEQLLSLAKKELDKPAEWSAEDERMLSRCVKSVECSKEFCDTETFKDAKDVEKDWLKSLPERFELQPKQEWSKEDEEIWKEIFGLCNRFGYDDACRKLRTLRPQPHWKPSEEQMEALRAAMEHKVCYCGCNHHALKSLYNDIQKLL